MLQGKDPVFLRVEDLIGSHWKFSHVGGGVATEIMRFLADGSIGNYDHYNEKSWRLDDGVLCLANGAGEVTARFESANRVDGRLLLLGVHRPVPDITLCLESSDHRPHLPGARQQMADQIEKYGWEVGEHSYGSVNALEPGMAKLKVGRFTSIATGLTVALGDHRTDAVSLYPFVELKRYWPTVPNGARDHQTKGDVVIGNDVWIGTNVFIGSGVTIGDGAVIGANAVVTRDVPAYAVAVGNPARVVKKRFSDDTVSKLLGIRWWDWNDDKIDRYLPLMLAGDVERFIEIVIQNQ